MNVSRSGYYNWRNNRNNQRVYKQNRNDLIEIVTEIHNDYPSFGYRSINALIKERVGWILSDIQVHKCCKYLGIKSKAKHYQWKKAGGESIKHKNIVNGDWNTKSPFEIIVSDTTSIWFNKKLYEWTYYLDVFNNEIISSGVGKYNSGSNIKAHYSSLKSMLNSKIKRGYKETPTVLHTDQGPIYTSKIFNNIHKDYNIIRSMSRAGTPTDNPIIESLNGWIKAGIAVDFDKSKYETVEDFINDVVLYVNKIRPSSKLHYKNPIQYRIE